MTAKARKTEPLVRMVGIAGVYVSRDGRFEARRVPAGWWRGTDAIDPKSLYIETRRLADLRGWFTRRRKDRP